MDIAVMKMEFLKLLDFRNAVRNEMLGTEYDARNANFEMGQTPPNKLERNIWVPFSGLRANFSLG